MYRVARTASRTATWRPAHSIEIPLSRTRLLKRLEADGYELQDGVLLAPGLDRFLAKWLESAQPAVTRNLWDRMELAEDREAGSFRSRWIYWTPANLALHLGISACCLLSPSFNEFALIFALGNLLPAALSWLEARKVRAIFLACGYLEAEPVAG